MRLLQPGCGDPQQLAAVLQLTNRRGSRVPHAGTQSPDQLVGHGGQRTAERYLAEGRYWMLGSDTHGVGGLEQRLAGLRRVRELVDAAAFDRLTRENPSRLI